MSGFGWKMTLAIAEPMVARIRNGKPIPIVAGILSGLACGLSTGFAIPELLPFGGLLGAIVGATAGAALFPRPPQPLGKRAPGEESDWLGDIRQDWTYEEDNFKSLAVLLDRAIYVVRDDKAPWDKVRGKLSQGIDPQLPLGDLIRLDGIDHVELRRPDATDPRIVYWKGSRIKRRGIDFESVEARDNFLAALEEQLGVPFVQAEEPMELRRAILTPLICLVVLWGLTIGSMLLSAHWIATPPPPTRGGKQDDLVRLLTWAGPQGILLGAALPLVAVTGWFLLRAARPPRIQVLRLAGRSATGHM
jgi:hypothetical protein